VGGALKIRPGRYWPANLEHYPIRLHHVPAAVKQLWHSLGVNARVRYGWFPTNEGLFEQRKSEIDDWRAKEATQDVMRQTIFDFLYSDETGLPGSYSPEEIAQKTQVAFGHIYTAMN
jgi:hypothetical protein